MNRTELEQQRAQIYRVLGRAEEGLKNGHITQEQHDALLQSYFGTTDVSARIAEIDAQLEQSDGGPNKAALLIAGFSIIMVSLFAFLLYSSGGITGAVIYEHNFDMTYDHNIALPLQLEAATRINMTGSASGNGSALVWLNIDGQRYLLYAYNRGMETAHASLQKYEYIAGEQVTFEARNLSSAYLLTNDAIMLENNTLSGLALGNYTLKLIINDTTYLQETLRFAIVNNVAQSEFNTCGEVCSTNISGNATVEIEVTDGTSVTIRQLLVSNDGNTAPQLVAEIPDVAAENIAYVNLAAAFNDPDGDELLYDSSHHEGMNETITNGILAISGMPGTYTYIAYASDLVELSPSNIFSVTIAATQVETGTRNESLAVNASLNETTPNATGNMTQSEQNATTVADNATTAMPNATNISIEQNVTVEPIDTTVNVTIELPTDSNATSEPIDECSAQDPNLRPLSCIQGNESSYFRPEEILLENKAAAAVGQLTPIGNLLIRGGLIEYSTGQPESEDYSLGYADEDGDYVATMWIDSDTGDLHLKGHLTEANGNIVIEEGLSAIANKRGIVLALVDRRTGDMTVRGNLVPYRRVIG